MAACQSSANIIWLVIFDYAITYLSIQALYRSAGSNAMIPCYNTPVYPGAASITYYPAAVSRASAACYRLTCQ